MLPNKPMRYKILKMNKNKNNKTMHANTKMINLLDDNKVKECLKQLHDDYVVVNADKASLKNTLYSV